MKLFQVGDLKVFAPGAGIALALGLMLGSVMQPHLDAGDGRPAGPQIVAGWEMGRSTGPFDPGLTLAAYHGQMPDYVLGTDWKKTMAAPDAQAAVSPPSRETAQAPAETDRQPFVLAVMSEDEAPPPSTHGYPSLGGGQSRVHAATDADVAADDDTLPAQPG